MNFISGRNGSGKSAVLQGIQACLGVRASDTGRSNTLASFIKEGASHSLISVTIHNTGDDAYEPEMYGNQITVERRIGHGSNTFVLKDQNKKKVASGRGALTAMLEALDINASNPVAVLTQDTARTFLAGSASDKKKYDLFMEVRELLWGGETGAICSRIGDACDQSGCVGACRRAMRKGTGVCAATRDLTASCWVQATLLEQIAERQQASKDRTEEIKSYLSQKKRVLSEEKKQLEELRERVTSLQRVADKREYSVALANAIAWQRVRCHRPPPTPHP